MLGEGLLQGGSAASTAWHPQASRAPTRPAESHAHPVPRAFFISFQERKPLLTGRLVTGSSSSSANDMLGSDSKCLNPNSAFFSIFLGKGPVGSGGAWGHGGTGVGLHRPENKQPA